MHLSVLQPRIWHAWPASIFSIRTPSPDFVFSHSLQQPAPRRLARKTTGRLSMTDAPPSGEAKPGCQRGPVCLCNADACPAPLCDGFVSAQGAAECYPEADRWVAISSIWKDFRCPSLEPVRGHCHRLPSEAKEKRLSSTHLLRPAGGLSNSPTPPAASPASPITSTSQGCFKRPGSSVGGPGMSTTANPPRHVFQKPSGARPPSSLPQNSLLRSKMTNQPGTCGLGEGPLCQNHGLSTWGSGQLILQIVILPFCRPYGEAHMAQQGSAIASIFPAHETERPAPGLPGSTQSRWTRVGGQHPSGRKRRLGTVQKPSGRLGIRQEPPALPGWPVPTRRGACMAAPRCVSVCMRASHPSSPYQAVGTDLCCHRLGWQLPAAAVRGLA